MSRPLVLKGDFHQLAENPTCLFSNQISSHLLLPFWCLHSQHFYPLRRPPLLPLPTQKNQLYIVLFTTELSSRFLNSWAKLPSSIPCSQQVKPGTTNSRKVFETGMMGPRHEVSQLWLVPMYVWFTSTMGPRYAWSPIIVGPPGIESPRVWSVHSYEGFPRMTGRVSRFSKVSKNKLLIKPSLEEKNVTLPMPMPLQLVSHP